MPKEITCVGKGNCLQIAPELVTTAKHGSTISTPAWLINQHTGEIDIFASLAILLVIKFWVEIIKRTFIKILI